MTDRPKLRLLRFMEDRTLELTDEERGLIAVRGMLMGMLAVPPTGRPPLLSVSEINIIMIFLKRSSRTWNLVEISLVRQVISAMVFDSRQESIAVWERRLRRTVASCALDREEARLLNAFERAAYKRNSRDWLLSAVFAVLLAVEEPMI